MIRLLRYVAVLAFFTAPAHAQENPIFFGLWEPYSDSVAGNSVLFEKGRLTYTSPSGDRTVFDYHIIRDFGDRLLVRSVDVEGDWVGYESLEMYHITEPRSVYSMGYRVLNVSSCIYKYVLPDLFADKDPDVIWGKLMAWSAKPPTHRKFHDCAIDEQGQFLANSQWGDSGKFSMEKWQE